MIDEIMERVDRQMRRESYGREQSSGTGDMILAMLALLAIIWFAKSIFGANAYNNGVCKYCGGKYVYQQAVSHYASTDYVYICDGCGDMIKINQFYRDAVVKDK